MTSPIALRDFGDAELMGVTFRNPDVRLAIDLVPPSGRRRCAIHIRQCRLFWMETDHMQNVIEQVIIGTSFADLPPTVCAELKVKVGEILRFSAPKILCLVGIVGIDLVAVGYDVSIVDDANAA